MRLAVLRERANAETRVAATAETVKKFIQLGLTVAVESGAGAHSAISDDDYRAAGAEIAPDAAAALAGAGIVLSVQAPAPAERALIPRGALLICIANAFSDPDLVRGLADGGIDCVAMELLPRITRAQSMDVLSSQANLAGYRAVIEAGNAFERGFPMMMTAAGTVPAAKVFVMGAGVAGLQAIATARRLGAVIEASDVRPAVKEQIESLGAKFLDVPYETDEEREAAQGVGGYARPMPPSWLARQSALVHERAMQADIVITTALIPGRAAPTLITAETVQSMRPGSVVVDLAAGRGAEADGRCGGNCPLTVADQVIVHHGVTIAGYTNLAAMVPADASALYARNLLDFMKLIVTKEGTLNIDLTDDIVAATLLCRDGEVTRK